MEHIFKNVLKKHYENSKPKTGTNIVQEKRKQFAHLLTNLADYLIKRNLDAVLMQLESLLGYLSIEEYIDELNLKPSDVDYLKMLYLCCCLISDNFSKDNLNEVLDLQKSHIGFTPLFKRIEEYIGSHWNNLRPLRKELEISVNIVPVFNQEDNVAGNRTPNTSKVNLSDKVVQADLDTIHKEVASSSDGIKTCAICNQCLQTQKPETRKQVAEGNIKDKLADDSKVHMNVTEVNRMQDKSIQTEKPELENYIEEQHIRLQNDISQLITSNRNSMNKFEFREINSHLKANTAELKKINESLKNNHSNLGKLLTSQIAQVKGSNKAPLKEVEKLTSELRNCDDIIKHEINAAMGTALDKISREYERAANRKVNYEISEDVYLLTRKLFDFQFNVYHYFERQYEFMGKFLKELPKRDSFIPVDELRTKIALYETKLEEMRENRKVLMTYRQSHIHGSQIDSLKKWPFHYTFEDVYTEDIVYKNFKPLILKVQSLNSACEEHRKQTFLNLNNSRSQAGVPITERTGAVRRQIIPEESPMNPIMGFRSWGEPTVTSTRMFREEFPALPDLEEQKRAMVFNYLSEKLPHVNLSELIDAMNILQTNTARFSRLSMQDILKKVEEILNATSTNQECAICLVEEEGKVISQLQCGHQFHEQCIKQWNQLNKNCPLCRRPIQLT